MSAVALLDATALAFLAVAFVLLAATPLREDGISRGLKYPLLIGLGLLAFVSLSNVLEHAGITQMLDEYEDYAEVLFVPLVAYLLYSRSSAEQLRMAEHAERETRREHGLLMGVVETTPAGIVVADTGGTVVFANDEARHVLGLSAETVPAQTPEAVAAALSAIVASAPVRGIRYRGHAVPEGSWYAVSATPLDDSAEGTARAVVVFQDITERVAAERELERYRWDLEQQVDRRTGELLEANRQLRRAVLSNQRLLANMSHELRTPLNSILGFTDVLLQGLPGTLNQEQRRQLGFVRQSGEQLLALVDSALELARIESGRSGITLTSVDLGAAVQEVVAPMDVIAAERFIALVCECGEGIRVTTDADKLGQVVRNLVTNAIKFTDPGGTVTVSVSEDSEAATICVADTGVGIAPEDQERIFEPFEQVLLGGTAHGTGLGLAICRELCDLLGYEIALQSTVGEGSRFTVRVPLEAESHDDDAAGGDS
jgi:PAS domain S-box-containing protein